MQQTFLNKRVLVKLLIAITLIFICCFLFFLNDWYRKSKSKPDSEGFYKVCVIVEDKNDKELSNEKYKTKDNSLYNLMNDNYTLKTKDGAYGKILLGIDTLITDFETTYIAIYINDSYSNYGLSKILLSDGDTYKFKETIV